MIQTITLDKLHLGLQTADTLLQKLDPNYFYHSWYHTFIDVLPAALYLARREGRTEQVQRLLEWTSAYHDTGFIEQYENNEPIGARNSRNELIKQGLEDWITESDNIILSTDPTIDPLSDLGALQKDADLSYIGTDRMTTISDKYRLELINCPGHPLKDAAFADNTWYQAQVNFLSNHTFYTRFAKKMFDKGKEKNLRMYEKLLERADDSNSLIIV